MVKSIVTIDGTASMAQDVRPFRSAAFALLCLAAALFAAGIWGELRNPAADPVARLLETLPQRINALLPAFLPASETTFGTFANIGGVMALAGLLLLTLRRPSRPAAAAPTLPRVTPRRPSDLRNARAARSGTATASSASAEPAPAPEATPPTRHAGRTFQRVALMLIGSVLIGLGAAYALGRASLPVPAFTPPGMPTDLTTPALAAIGGALILFALVRILRRRRAAA
jgi:uncharacterized membrane protein YedE/YeeE